jgi:hypothetical protein
MSDQIKWPPFYQPSRITHHPSRITLHPFVYFAYFAVINQCPKINQSLSLSHLIRLNPT